jgi:hypothetical protein
VPDLSGPLPEKLRVRSLRSVPCKPLWPVDPRLLNTYYTRRAQKMLALQPQETAGPFSRLSQKPRRENPFVSRSDSPKIQKNVGGTMALGLFSSV